MVRTQFWPVWVPRSFASKSKRRFQWMLSRGHSFWKMPPWVTWFFFSAWYIESLPQPHPFVRRSFAASHIIFQVDCFRSIKQEDRDFTLPSEFYCFQIAELWCSSWGIWTFVTAPPGTFSCSFGMRCTAQCRQVLLLTWQIYKPFHICTFKIHQLQGSRTDLRHHFFEALTLTPGSTVSAAGLSSLG